MNDYFRGRIAQKDGFRWQLTNRIEVKSYWNSAIICLKYQKRNRKMVNISKKYYKFVRIMILQGIYIYSFIKEIELKMGEYQ